MAESGDIPSSYPVLPRNVAAGVVRKPLLDSRTVSRLAPRVRHLNERLEIVQPGALIQVDLHVRSFCSLVLADNEFHEALPFKPDAAEQVGGLSMLRV